MFVFKSKGATFRPRLREGAANGCAWGGETVDVGYQALMCGLDTALQRMHPRCGATIRMRAKLVLIDGVERPRYRQHLGAKTWSLLTAPQGKKPCHETNQHYRPGFGQERFSNPRCRRRGQSEIQSKASPH